MMSKISHGIATLRAIIADEKERGMAQYIFIPLFIFIVAIALGYYTAMVETQQVIKHFQELLADISGLADLGPVTLFLVVFFNNTIKTFFMMTLGILAGIIPALFIFFNGYVLGIISFLSTQQVGIFSLLVGVVPHGIIEIPTMIVACGYGMWLGVCALRKIFYGEPLLVHLRHAMTIFKYIFVPLLFVAAFVEIFITGYLLEVFF